MTSSKDKTKQNFHTEADTKDVSSFSELINAFISFLTTERQLSINTIESYQRDLKKFSKYCTEQNLQNINDVDSHTVRQFIGQLHRKGIGGKTIQRNLSSLRSFFNYLLKEKKAHHNPALGISAPKSARKLPKTLDTEQVSYLLSFKDDDPLAIRDKAIMELLYSSGFRISELVSLNIKTIDYKNGSVSVTRQ